ncbi:hypothetical protein JCM11641_005658 [Rhodosporidiobolus odoratus]
MAQPASASLADPSASRRPSNNSSDFLLLTHERSPLLTSSSSSSPHTAHSPSHHALPPPRYRWVLQTACIVDFTVTLSAAQAVSLSKIPITSLLLSLARPVVVGAAVSNSRVSLLILLYRSNELVQRRSSPPLPPNSPPSFCRVLIDLPPLTQFTNPTTNWYLLSFSFSLLHYLLFAIFVDVRRRRNPFSGSRGLRALGRAGRGQRWGEMEWEGREENVSSGGGGRGRRTSRALRSSEAGVSFVVDDANVEGRERELEAGEGEGEVGEEAEEERDDDELATTSSEDEDEDSDDIIDIPRRGGVGGAATSSQVSDTAR